jgi:hypothetical protein
VYPFLNLATGIFRLIAFERYVLSENGVGSFRLVPRFLDWMDRPLVFLLLVLERREHACVFRPGLAFAGDPNFLSRYDTLGFRVSYPIYLPTYLLPSYSSTTQRVRRAAPYSGAPALFVSGESTFVFGNCGADGQTFRMAAIFAKSHTCIYMYRAVHSYSQKKSFISAKSVSGWRFDSSVGRILQSFLVHTQDSPLRLDLDRSIPTLFLHGIAAQRSITLLLLHCGEAL